MPLSVVQHGIFKHLWPLALLLWAWTWKVYLCLFWACINASIVKMDRLTHYHIMLCLTIDLWPWHWKAGPCWFSVINASILKMDIATLPHKVVQQGNLKHFLVEYLHFKWCICVLQYKLWSWGSQTCNLLLFYFVFCYSVLTAF